MAIWGNVSGTAHITEAAGGALLRIRPACAPQTVAWLLRGDALLRVSLQNEKEEAVGRFAPPLPDALLLEQEGRILGYAGFAGRDALRLRAAQEVRLRAYALAPATDKSAQDVPAGAQNTPVQNTAAQAAAPQAASAPAQAAPESRAPTRAVPEPTAPTQAAPASTAPANTPAGSDALLTILRMAQTLFPQNYATPSAAPPPEPPPAQPPAVPPFSMDAFPGVAWKQRIYPGTRRCYMEGFYRDARGGHKLYAIPGAYAPVPPVRGFSRFCRATDGSGWWVREGR